MKEDINLLPPAAIASRATGIYLRRLGSLHRYLLILVVTVILVLGGIYAALEWQTRVLVEANRESASLNQEYVTTVTTINEQLAAVQSWRQEHVAWTPLLVPLLAEVPTEVVLTEIKLDEKTSVLHVGGTFTTREALLAFQRRIESLPWVASVEAPLSNFATGNDARFSFLITRKPLP